MGTWKDGVFYRTAKEQKQEDEASCFACMLLMPTGLFQQEVDREYHTKGWESDQVIHNLAKRFQVPLFAVVMRFQILYKHRV